MSDATLDLAGDSAFSAVLRWLGRPGYAVRNVLKGNIGGAARQAADFVLDPWDAFLPGDLIPEISNRQTDYTEASDLVGGMEPGLGKFAVDFAGGMLTDPLTYTGLGLIKYVAMAPAKAGVAAAQAVAPKIPGGVKALEQVAERGKKAGMGLRSMIGAERIAPNIQQIMQKAEALEGASLSAQQKALAEAMGTLKSADDQALAAAVMQNVTGKGTAAREIIPEGVTAAPYTATETVRDVMHAAPASATSIALRNAAARPDDVVEVSRDPIAKMMGAVEVQQPTAARSGADMANVTDATIMQQGGLVPGLTRTAVADMPSPVDRMMKLGAQKQAVRERLTALGVTGAQAERVATALDKYIDTQSGSFRELVEKGAFTKPQGVDLLSESPMYHQRVYEAAEDAIATSAQAGGRVAAAKARTLPTGKELADYLQKNPDVMLSDEFAKVAFGRGAQQAQMLKQAALARGVVDDVAKRADEKMSKASREVENWTGMQGKVPPGDDLAGFPDKYKAAGLTKAEALAYEAKYSALFGAGNQSTPLAKAMNAALEELTKADPETAGALSRAYHGLEPRGAFLEAVSKVNRIFKPYATAGAFVPRLSFSVRNVVTGGGVQVLMNPKARAYWPQYAKGVAGNLVRSLDDGIEHLTGTRRLSADDMKQVNDALRLSGGRVDDAAQRIADPTLREALQSGVITDGFASSELLAEQLARTGWSKTWRDIRDWPAAIVAGTEKRMRYSVFKAMREKGVPVDEAAQVAEDTFFKYRPTSELNRAARDIIPFFQFTAKATPQALRAIVNAKGITHPGTLTRVGAQALYAQGADAILPPWLHDNPRIPLGRDADGNPKYLTSMGLPFEVLGQIPNPSDSPLEFAKQIRQNVVGASNPALKTAASAIFGVDPFFGSTFGSYDKAPYLLQQMGVPERSEAGRVYNLLAGTGLIQPIASPVQYVSAMMDPRRNKAEAAINAVTGARIQTVDEQRALQQSIEAKLKSDPSIARYETLYAYSPDPEQQELLDHLRRVKAEIRAKKKDAEPQE
jgi:hypothetical protein